jgi:hypothetical protein
MAKVKAYDPFDFSKAKGSTPAFNFATANIPLGPPTPGRPAVNPLFAPIAPKSYPATKALRWRPSALTPRPKFDESNVAMAGFNPWSALSMFAMRAVRAGVMRPELGAAFVVAKNAPKSQTALKLGASMVRASVKEADALLMGEASTMFTRSFSASPAQAAEYYRALAKIMGQVAPRFPSTVSPLIKATGQVLRNTSRKYGR